jgi:hypothetical protein
MSGLRDYLALKREAVRALVARILQPGYCSASLTMRGTGASVSRVHQLR